MPLKLIKNQQGHYLIEKGHIYTLKSEGSNQFIWRCIKWRNSSCKGKCYTSTKDRTGKVISEIPHKHAPDAALVEAKAMMAKMKSKATKTQEPPSNIIASVMKTANVSSSSKLPNPSLLTRTIQRIRKTENPVPPEPTSAKDLIIPAEYTLTHQNKQFLYYDSEGEDTSNRTMIFTTESNLEILSSCEIWQADGTFDCVPKNFSQLYTIHGISNEHTLPLVYILTTGSSTKVYKNILQQLKSMHENLNPKIMICDFELAFHNAMKKIFPETKIIGCFFHFTQCIWRQIQSAGLQPQYSKDSILQLNLKMIAALAFVPPVDVIYAFEKLINTKYYTENEKTLESIIDYVERVWIGVLNRRNVRSVPRYAIDVWNQHESTLQNIPRTNNSVEGWHNALNRRAGASHLNIWKIIELMRKEQNLTELKINQIEAAMESPKKKKKYRDIDARIHELVTEYN